MKKFVLILAFLFMPYSAFAWIPPADLIFPCAEGKDVEWSVNQMLESKEQKDFQNSEDCKLMIINEIEANIENRSSDIICSEKDYNVEEIYQKFQNQYKQGDYENETFMTVVDYLMIESLDCQAVLKPIK